MLVKVPLSQSYHAVGGDLEKWKDHKLLEVESPVHPASGGFWSALFFQRQPGAARMGGEWHSQTGLTHLSSCAWHGCLVSKQLQWVTDHLQIVNDTFVLCVHCQSGGEKMAPAKVTTAVIVVVLKVTGRSAQVYRVCASFGQVPSDCRLWADQGTRDL